MTRKVNIAEKHGLFSDSWKPKIVGQVNDVLIKLVKLQGEFTWHSHTTEDELFLVTKGKMRMKFRDGDEFVGEGEFIIVPHGVEHCPVAETDEVHVLLVEPASTLNTGDANDDRRVEKLERI